jgi:hypothetical protein
MACEFDPVVDVATLGILPENTPEQIRQNSARAKAHQLKLREKNIEGQRWVFAPGEYNFAEPLTIIQRLWLEGPVGGPKLPQTRLSFPDGAHGLVFEGTLPDTGQPDHRSAGAKATNLWIVAKGKSRDLGHGIIIEAAVHLADLVVDNFRGDGIHISTQEKTPTQRGTNASGFYIERVYASNCGEKLEVDTLTYKRINNGLGEFDITTIGAHRLKPGDRFFLYSPYWLHDVFNYIPNQRPKPEVFHCGNYIVVEASPNALTAAFADSGWGVGISSEDEYYRNPDNRIAKALPYSIITGHGLFTRGSDANVGTIASCYFSGNKGYAVVEHSMYGNTYVGCTAEANFLGPYFSINHATNNSVFLGCYSEGDQPPSILHPSKRMGEAATVVMGGTHGALIKRTFLSGGQGPLLGGVSRFLGATEAEQLNFSGLRDTAYPAGKPNTDNDSHKTWEKGDRVRTYPHPSDEAVLDGAEGWICDKPGTFKRGRKPEDLPQVNTDGTRIVTLVQPCRDPDGNPILCVSDPGRGEYVVINGTPARVENKALVGTHTQLVMSTPIPAGTNLPISYEHEPTFKKFGNIR